MAAQVTVLTGPARSGKTAWLLDRYRPALSGPPVGRALWLAPTQRSVHEVRARLLSSGLDACFRPGVMTFDHFAQGVVRASSQDVRPITRLMQYQLIRRVMREAASAGAIKQFAQIAELPGLAELVVEFIREMKRLEIWPQELERAHGQVFTGSKYAELAWIYSRYQELLTTHQLYDAEGVFWSARAMLHEGQTAPFESLQIVVADGFNDFTRTQHEILQLLAERVGELYVSLPMGDSPGRDDLFAKCRATLDQLQRRHKRVEIEKRGASQTWPALAHVERELFRDPRQVRPADTTDGIELWAAARQIGELERIAQRIKQLITQGDAETLHQPVPPGQIAVVFRSVSEVAPLVREVFESYGLPVSLESGEPLQKVPVLKALVSVLTLEIEDWPMRTLLAVLLSNYFRPALGRRNHAHAVRVAERVVRNRQVPKGRRTLLDRIDQFAAWREAALMANRADDEFETVPTKADIEDAKAAKAVLENLGKALDKLPDKASPSQWADALGRLAADLGMAPAEPNPAAPVPGGPIAQFDAADRSGWDRLLEALSEIEDLEGRLESQAIVWDASQLRTAVLDILRWEQAPLDYDEAGRIRVLSAPSVRALTVPYLFVAGLSEQSFPRRAIDNGLLQERESRRLAEAGLPVVLEAERSKAEMLLFYEVLTRATRRLWLSYPALDEKAQELLPSPYLVDLQRACGMERLKAQAFTDLSPVPRGRELLSFSDWRVKSVADGLANESRLLAGLCQHASTSQTTSNILAGLRLTQDRKANDRFGRYEGVLLSEPARRAMLARYGPQHCFSPSRLESYAACPYRFFAEDVLKLEQAADLELEVNYARRGVILHRVLAELHRAVNERHGEASSPIRSEADDFRSQFLAAVERLLSDGLAGPLAEALAEIDRQVMNRWADRYWQQHQRYDERLVEYEFPLRPSNFEVSFGLTPVASDPLSTEEPLLIGEGDEQVQISGRIDRLDIGRARGAIVFNVVDYKTGARRPPAIKDAVFGSSLQLPIYTLAVQKLLLRDQDTAGCLAGLWLIAQRDGFKSMFRLTRGDDGNLRHHKSDQSFEGPLVEWILALVRGIRRAEFPMFSDDSKCTGHCPMNTVCRVNHTRALAKPWKPPEVAPS